MVKVLSMKHLGIGPAEMLHCTQKLFKQVLFSIYEY